MLATSDSVCVYQTKEKKAQVAAFICKYFCQCTCVRLESSSVFSSIKDVHILKQIYSFVHLICKMQQNRRDHFICK